MSDAGTSVYLRPSTSVVVSSLHERNSVAVRTNGKMFNALIDVSVFLNNSLILIIFLFNWFYFATPTLLLLLVTSASFYASKISG